MIAYVDSSVLLRLALGQPNSLPQWREIEHAVSSALIATESLRNVDRLRLRVRLSDVEIADRRASVLRLLDSLELVELDATVLERAAQPVPTELGTLDAIHLASALLWKDWSGIRPVVATHYAALGVAARAYGFDVVGV
jgi:predicted nucleic acid-binding protein